MPVVLCDARELASVKQVLISLVEHVAASHARATELTASPSPAAVTATT
jgi:hypothetical protein